MFTVPGHFIGSFKLGDNIYRNLAILSAFYAAMEVGETEYDRALYYKPIIVWIGSITEAMLHDIHYRARTFTKEGIKTLSDDVLSTIRSKALNDQDKYIASARKHDILKTEGKPKLYDHLDELRRLRNRLHIQNAHKDFEIEDHKAFTKERLTMAERILERVAKGLAKHYKRPNHAHFSSDFTFPWKEHFPKYYVQPAEAENS